MKTFTYKDICSWDPCYDPIKYLPKNWKGTTVDILNHPEIPFEDKLWCVLRTELITDKTMRLFAVWSYRQTLTFIKNPDPRSLQASYVAEQFALGNATAEELSAAESAAWSAAESAAWSAAESAAWSARSAAESAAEFAAWSARSAAWSAAESARSAAWSAQKDKLIEMIITYG